jgi:hypothetical protein
VTTWLLVIAVVWGSLLVGIGFGWLLRKEFAE